LNIYPTIKRKRSTKWDVLERDVKALLMIRREGKLLKEVAGALGVGESLLSKSLSETRKALPKLVEITNLVGKERLLDASKRRTGKEIRQIRIGQAEKGIFLGTVPIGFRREGNTLVPVPEQAKRVEAVFFGTLEGRRPAELVKETGFSTLTIQRTRRNPVYKGEFTFLGKTCKGNWKPLVDPHVWDEVQRRVGPATGLLWEYRWVDGKKLLRPGAKEKYEMIFKMRSERNSIEEISKTVGLGNTTVQRILRDRRITGKAEVDGKLVDSGFEPAVDEETWKAVQKKRAPGRAERQAAAFRDLKREIMRLTPAYRWELVEKIHVSRVRIESAVGNLKNEGMVKEERGLLQKAWMSFPEKRLETRFRVQSLNRRKVLSVLSSAEEGLTCSELKRKTGFYLETLKDVVSGLVEDGFVQRAETKPARFKCLA
jgi:DNA invertase Pin-like site-specific DNA recombinase